MTTEEELDYLRTTVKELQRQVDTLKNQLDSTPPMGATDWVTTLGKPEWDRPSAPVRYRINAKTDGVQYWQQHEFVYADGSIFREEWIPTRKSFVEGLFKPDSKTTFQELYQQQVPKEYTDCEYEKKHGFHEERVMRDNSITCLSCKQEIYPPMKF